ncbi:tetratricopeptide repeat protein [Engelhardtia mirabilis]
MFDREGNAVLIDAEEYRTGILPRMFESVRQQPDQLYALLVDAFGRGWFEDGLESARALIEVDPNRERAATMLGIALMQTGRLDEAQAVLEAQVASAGPSGVVLTNLAKVRANRGDHEGAEALLWEALQLDPNVPNSVEWWGAIARERDGEAGWITALERVAALDGSWRAQLWLARTALEAQDPERALELYAQALPRAREYGDALMMISGDLGRTGHPGRAVALIEPVYDPAVHGPTAGFNLIHASLQVGEREAGLRVLGRLEALERKDISRHLSELRARFEDRAPD